MTAKAPFVSDVGMKMPHLVFASMAILSICLCSSYVFADLEPGVAEEAIAANQTAAAKDAATGAPLQAIQSACQLFLARQIPLVILGQEEAPILIDEHLARFKKLGLDEAYDPARESVEVFSSLSAKSLAAPLVKGTQEYELANRQYQRLLALRQILSEGTHELVVAKFKIKGTTIAPNLNVRSIFSTKNVSAPRTFREATWALISTTIFSSLVVTSAADIVSSIQSGQYGSLPFSALLITLNGFFGLPPAKRFVAYIKNQYADNPQGTQQIQVPVTGPFATEHLGAVFAEQLKALGKGDQLHLGFSNHLNRAVLVENQAGIKEALSHDRGEKTPFVQLVKNDLLTEPIFTDSLGFGYYSVDIFATGGEDVVEFFLTLPKKMRP